MDFFRDCQKTFSLCVLVCILACMFTGCGLDGEDIAKTQHNWLTDDTVISLYQHETGEVIQLPLKEYLYGVVAGEMDVNWPVEALAAQAIMARTFTLEKIEDGGVQKRGTDASTDIHEFQAYDASKINDRVKQAVDKTENQVAVYGGELIKAWFFADGGGRTAASAKEGLAYEKEAAPYIESVEDPGFTLPDNPNRTWETYFTMKQVADAVESVTGVRREKFQQVHIAEQGDSGRVMKYDFDGLSVGAAALRLALGGETLKSNMIEEIAIRDGRLMVKGRGYGHGVGMSQWGAKALAEKGEDAEDIVEYFFDDIEIVRVQP